MNDESAEDGSAKKSTPPPFHWEDDCVKIRPWLSHTLQVFLSLIFSIAAGTIITLVIVLLSYCACGPKGDMIAEEIALPLWSFICGCFFISPLYRPTGYIQSGPGFIYVIEASGGRLLGDWDKTRPEGDEKPRNKNPFWFLGLSSFARLIEHLGKMGFLKKGIVLTEGDHGAIDRIFGYWKCAVGGNTFSVPCNDLFGVNDEIESTQKVTITLHSKQGGGPPELASAWLLMNPFLLVKLVNQQDIKKGLRLIWEAVVDISSSFLSQALAGITLSELKDRQNIEATIATRLRKVRDDDSQQVSFEMLYRGRTELVTYLKNGLGLLDTRAGSILPPQSMVDAMDNMGAKVYEAQGKAAAMQITRAALEAIPDAKLREDVLIVEEHLSGQEVSRNRLEIEVDLGVPEDRASEAYKHIADIAKSPAATVLATQAALRKGKGSARKSDKDKKKG